MHRQEGLKNTTAAPTCVVVLKGCAGEAVAQAGGKAVGHLVCLNGRKKKQKGAESSTEQVKAQ